MDHYYVRIFLVNKLEKEWKFLIKQTVCPHSIVVNVLGWDIIVRDFTLQLLYYVHFQTYTLCKKV